MGPRSRGAEAAGRPPGPEPDGFEEGRHPGSLHKVPRRRVQGVRTPQDRASREIPGGGRSQEVHGRLRTRHVQAERSHHESAFRSGARPALSAGRRPSRHAGRRRGTGSSRPESGSSAGEARARRRGSGGRRFGCARRARRERHGAGGDSRRSRSPIAADGER